MDIKDYFIIAGIIAAAILAGAYSVYQYIDGVKKDRSTSELNKKLVDAQTKALEKAEELINAQKETQALAQKLEIANEEIREKTNALIKTQSDINDLQNETLRNVTGFGHAVITVELSKLNSLYLSVQSRSKYHIFQPQIIIINYSEMQKCTHFMKNNLVYYSKDCFNRNSKNFTLASLKPENYSVLDYTIDPAIKELHLLSNISSLHMTTVQYSIIQYELNSKEFKHAFQVFQVDRKTGIYTLIEDHSLDIPKAKWMESFPYMIGINVEGDF